MPEPVLSISGLRHAYAGRTAVDGVDLEVGAGEAVALLGPNGAGKSTTVAALLGLITPDGGRVAVCGTTPARAVAGGAVGAMLQDSGLPDGARVREVVALFGALYRSAMSPDDALRTAGAEDLGARPIDALSGGQQQRVRLALALVGDPRLLVLDEPTAAMDPEARRDFWASLHRQTAGERGLLFATHHLDEAQAVADRVVVLAGGRVVASGTPAQVAARAGATVLRAHVPDAVAAELRDLPGVLAADEGPDGRVALRCADSDAALRALLERHRDAHRIEVRESGLEDAFLAMAGAGWSAAAAAPADPADAPTVTDRPDTSAAAR